VITGSYESNDTLFTYTTEYAKIPYTLLTLVFVLIKLITIILY